MRYGKDVYTTIFLLDHITWYVVKCSRVDGVLRCFWTGPPVSDKGFLADTGGVHQQEKVLMDTDFLPPESTELSSTRVPDELVQAAHRYAEAEHATSTKRAYSKDWSTYIQWCRTSNRCPIPATPETVALYLTYRAELGRKPSVIERDLTTISVAHQKANHESPRKFPLVRQVMKGIRRTKGTLQRQATPLLPNDLKAISQDLPDKLVGLRDRALLLIGFAGALRRSELVALNVDDVSFVDNGLEILIRRSKTDQEAKGEKKGIPFGSDPATCPVRALRAWLNESHLQKGSLFRAIDKYGNIRLGTLTGRSVARIVKLRAKEVGLSADCISGHSLRAGLATAAARAGKSAHAIMRQTGHKSLNMVQKYVREATLFADNAASGIGL